MSTQNLTTFPPDFQIWNCCKVSPFNQSQLSNWLLIARRFHGQSRRISAELERTIVRVRQRLASQAHPGTRYSLIGANAIPAELRTLHIRPLPSVRTLERVLERNGETVPKVRLAPYLARSTYPKPQANHSNQLHQVDAGSPLYLKGNKRRTRIRKLPPNYVVPTEPLNIAAGHITFIRQVTAHGNVHLLSQTFFVGKRVKGEYVKVQLDTKRAQLTVYRHGRIFKRWPYPFLKK